MLQKSAKFKLLKNYIYCYYYFKFFRLGIVENMDKIEGKKNLDNFGKIGLRPEKPKKIPCIIMA